MLGAFHPCLNSWSSAARRQQNCVSACFAGAVSGGRAFTKITGVHDKLLFDGQRRKAMARRVDDGRAELPTSTACADVRSCESIIACTDRSY